MTDTKLKILEVLRIPIRMGKKYPGKPIMFKLQKIKHKEKPLKEARRKNTLPIKKNKNKNQIIPVFGNHARKKKEKGNT